MGREHGLGAPGDALRPVPASRIKKNRSRAKEPPKIKPVADDVVDKTLPYLPSPIAAMVRLQRLTGMRPGGVCAMRPCDIDTSHDVWVYVPWEYKSDHHEDCQRFVPFGPKSQSILVPYLIDAEDNPEKWLFSPKESMSERHRKARKHRKTKVQPSQQDRRKPNPKCLPKEKYDKDAYCRAIRRAARKAGVPHWSPNQLRHSALTERRAKEGVEAAQLMGNHKNVQITEIYAEKDIAKALELARKYG